jgi:hypothetical protein
MAAVVEAPGRQTGPAAPCPDDPFGLLAPGGAGDPAVDAAVLHPVAPFGLQTPEGAHPGDSCPECGCPLVVQDMSYECPSCHAIFEAADIQDVIPVSTPETAGSGALRGRLRVVGREAGWFQPDLDRTNPGESSEAQKKSTYQELLRYNREYESRGGNPFPLDVLDYVASNYHTIQQQSVKRSMMKRVILAALTFHVCIAQGFTRTRAEAAELLQLTNYGIARGDDYLRSVDEDRGLDLNLNTSRLRPHIVSVFAQLDLTGTDHKAAQDAVADIVEAAGQNFIGDRSVLRSKVIASTYEALRRGGRGVALDTVTVKCQIRKHTIRRFLDELGKYHSRFEPIYNAYGLDPAPPAEAR